MPINADTKNDLPRIQELPDPFLRADSSRVTSEEEWSEQREYLKELLAVYMYGKMPPAPASTRGEILFSRPVYGGQAIAESVLIHTGPSESISFRADLIRPNIEGKVPVITRNQFADRDGSPIEEDLVCRRGYAIIEFDREQLAADNNSALDGPLARAYPDYDWGTTAMWAWGQSRVLDYLLTTEFADPEKIAATGHSRGGKVALCAAIYDERFAVCVPNNSGCGGAGCFRFLGSRLGRDTGTCETIGVMADAFPYWWTDRFGKFGRRSLEYTRSTCGDIDTETMRAERDPALTGTLGDEAYLPFDLHTAKALIAPRPLLTTEALGDTWANTYGTQVTWRAAQEVYDFLRVPELNAIHFREGGHAFSKDDWEALADFCDRVFRGKEPEKRSIIHFPPADSRPDPRTAPLDWRSKRLHYSWRNPSAGTSSNQA